MRLKGIYKDFQATLKLIYFISINNSIYLIYLQNICDLSYVNISDNTRFSDDIKNASFTQHI